MRPYGQKRVYGKGMLRTFKRLGDPIKVVMTGLKNKKLGRVYNLKEWE